MKYPKTIIQVAIFARKKRNETGIVLKKGYRYNFIVDAKDSWTDFFVKTNANGFESLYGFMRKKEKDRPMPKENWCTLIGQIDNIYFRIGTGLKNWKCPVNGPLICLANDTWYWNNWGKIQLKIEELGQ